MGKHSTRKTEAEETSIGEREGGYKKIKKCFFWEQSPYKKQRQKQRAAESEEADKKKEKCFWGEHSPYDNQKQKQRSSEREEASVEKGKSVVLGGTLLTTTRSRSNDHRARGRREKNEKKFLFGATSTIRPQEENTHLVRLRGQV